MSLKFLFNWWALWKELLLFRVLSFS